MFRPLALSIAAAALALSACGPSQSGARGPNRPVAEWQGDEKNLFDDGVDSNAIPSMALASTPEDFEARAFARTPKSDSVVVAKVVGVTREPVGEKYRYRLDLAVEGPPLSGSAIEGHLELTVDGNAPSFGIVRSQDAKLIGNRFVVFVKRYFGDEGPVTHFHLAAADKKILDAVDRARLRREVTHGAIGAGSRRRTF